MTNQLLTLTPPGHVLDGRDRFAAPQRGRTAARAFLWTVTRIDGRLVWGVAFGDDTAATAACCGGVA